ncbi:MAG: Hsp70 family protein [Verrucomicrobiaceae bacterium]|nr:Hsp70 family protein [Verrucomicrobiaceae bacterium]
MDNNLILGIDLGTTNSLVGVVDAGFPILLADKNGERSTPSVVHYGSGGHITVGTAARRQQVLDSARTVFSVKRLIGRRPGESDWEPPYDLRVLGTTPSKVSAEILKHLKQVAEDSLGQNVSRAVITVPAFFNDAQRAATKHAAELAGLSVDRILAEPTAAALAYGLDQLGERKRVAVYDFGGGTFDISILEMRDGVFQVLSTAGDTQLGGDDIDAALVRYLKSKRDWTAAEDVAQDAAWTEAAERAKRQLSTHDSVEVILPFIDGSHSFHVVVERAELEQMARPFVDRTIKHCQRALHDAKLNVEDLDEVILVGGSTRMPLVRQRVRDAFKTEPNLSQNPDEAVAKGAVIQAGILSGALRQMILLDVTPLSLGIETFGGLMNIIIPRNSTIPCKAGEMFTNAVAGQESMLIRVLQGERELAKDNWELGRVEVPFPSGAKGTARVGVQFSIDADGILSVLARDTATGKDTVLEIQNTAVDVDDSRVEEMINASVEHALDDMNERIWTEAKMKSEELLAAVDEALPLVGDAVDTGAIRRASSAVREILEAELHDATALKRANATLDDVTQSLAVLLVERAMEEALDRKLGL